MDTIIEVLFIEISIFAGAVASRVNQKITRGLIEETFTDTKK